MAERLDDVLIHGIIAGNQSPEGLSAKLLIITLIRFVVPPITATVNSDEVLFIADNLARLTEVIAHFLYLTGVPPVWAGLDGNDIAHTIAIEFKIDAFGGRLTTAMGFLANINCQGFEKVTENGLLLRGEMRIQQLLDQLPGCFYVLGLEQIGIFPAENFFKL